MTEFPHTAAITLAAALAVAVFVGRMRRTRAARRRFERMLAAAHHPSRRLLEVLGPLRRVESGQLLLVIDVRTGQEATVWLRTPALTPGELALLVWMDGRWVLMERLPARRLRRAAPARRVGFRAVPRPRLVRSDDAIVREAERYLRS